MSLVRLHSFVTATVLALAAGVPGALADGPDFNGDGYDDLAASNPYEDFTTTIADHGVVHVLYGGANGLRTDNDDLWDEYNDGAPGKREEGDLYGFALGWGDFDGDGYDDLAIGCPYENYFGNEDAGQVVILFGSSSGLTSTGAITFTQESLGIGIVSEPYDAFGWSVAGGDFDNDGYDDLAIGVPGEDVESAGVYGCGNAVVLYGSASGLADAIQWNQNSGGIGDERENDERYGWSLAAGDFDADGYDDLAVSAIQELVGSEESGAVTIIYGSAKGLTGAGDQLIYQGASVNGGTIRGLAESGDYFGWSLAAGDFDASGTDDLAIGVPEETISVDTQGAVNVVYGLMGTGLSGISDDLWDQGDTLGTPEACEHFGGSLASGDINGVGGDDLIIGVPGEIDYGGINVLYGSTGSGLSVTSEDLFTQATLGVLGVPYAGENFGGAVGVGDFNGDGFLDVVIGVVLDTGAPAGTGGCINVLDGASDGVTTLGDQQFWQGVGGVKNSAESGDLFGYALTGGSGFAWGDCGPD